MVPNVRIYMSQSSAVVALTRAHVVSPLVVLYPAAACGSFDDRTLLASGVAPYTQFVAITSYERWPGLTRSSEG